MWYKQLSSLLVGILQFECSVSFAMIYVAVAAPHSYRSENIPAYIICIGIPSFCSIRILPHHQDTGGFFVAVLEKTKPLPGEKVYKDSDQVENTTLPDTATQRTRQVSIFHK